MYIKVSNFYKVKGIIDVHGGKNHFTWMNFWGILRVHFMWIPVISCISCYTYISTVCLFEVENAFDVIDMLHCMLWYSLSSGWTKYIALQYWMENSILSNRNVKAELWFPWRRKNVCHNISIWRDFNQSIRNTWERMGKGRNRKLILLVVCEKIIKIFNVFFW